MIVKQLTEHHLECLSLKRGCTCLSESTLVKIPHCWKSHVTAQLLFQDVCGSIVCRDKPDTGVNGCVIYSTPRMDGTDCGSRKVRLCSFFAYILTIRVHVWVSDCQILHSCKKRLKKFMVYFIVVLI